MSEPLPPCPVSGCGAQTIRTEDGVECENYCLYMTHYFRMPLSEYRTLCALVAAGREALEKEKKL